LPALSGAGLSDLKAAPGKGLSVTATVTVTGGSTVTRTIRLQITAKPTKPKHPHRA
jgi:hypothetical protein